MAARLAALAAALATSAAAFRVKEPATSPKSGSPDACEADDLAMARMVHATCHINWALNGNGEWPKTMRVGCWDLLAYNTDKFFSSTVYQRKTDNRCALVFSGYHGALAGYVRGLASLSWPPMTWNLCGYQMYAPYVRLFQHHTSLGNWSKLMHALAGPASTCEGEPIFGAESMGGSTGEMLAACANAGRLGDLMPKNLPSFKLEELYTFGSPGVSTVPLANSLRPDGCFRGKRIFFSGDMISHVGSAFMLRHPLMDAVEIWPSQWDLDRKKFSRPSAQRFPCKSKEAVGDLLARKPPPPQVRQEFNGEIDPLQHSATSYEADMHWFHDVGLGNLFSNDVQKTDDVHFLALNVDLGEMDANLTSARYISEYALLS